MVLPGISADQWQAFAVKRQGQDLPLRLEHIGGSVRVSTAWAPANAGHHSVVVERHSERVEHLVTVESGKVSAAQLATLITDLEERLPASIAMSLDALGAFARVNWQPPQPQTLAQELATVRRALEGDNACLGLLSLLPAIALRPHQTLREQERWVLVHTARRLHPHSLVAALSRPGNVVDLLPLRVADRRAISTYDVYENRLIRAFVQQADQRLRLLEVAALREPGFRKAYRAVLQELRGKLDRAWRNADFLSEVKALQAAPDRVTQVLLHRPDYRAAYSGFLRFRQVPRLRLDHPAMDAPLQDVPKLYEAWGVLTTINAMLEAAAQHQWTATEQTLVAPSMVAPLVRVLPGGPVLSLRRGTATATLSYQRAISRNGADLRSITYTQRPDLILDVRDTDWRAVHVFDPKYKVDRGESNAARPMKNDIDKMHAYRDAIRDEAGRHIVSSAAILHPGRDMSFVTAEVAAHELLPGSPHLGLCAAVACALA